MTKASKASKVIEIINDAGNYRGLNGYAKLSDDFINKSDTILVNQLSESFNIIDLIVIKEEVFKDYWIISNVQKFNYFSCVKLDKPIQVNDWVCGRNNLYID